MDLNSFFIQENAHAFVQTRLDSARRYRYGTGSMPVAMIGQAAAALRRAAAAVEGWARPSADPVISAQKLPSR